MVLLSRRAGLQGWKEFRDNRSQRRPSQPDAEIRSFLDPIAQAQSVGTPQGTAAEYPHNPNSHSSISYYVSIT